jgi:hypothetical protein
MCRNQEHPRPWCGFAMPAILYTCPSTGDHVSAWVADDPENNGERFEAIMCLACQRVHAVNPKTGKVASAPATSGRRRR